MRLCGISSRFQLLSPCIRQVAHALLTRPPLNFRKSIRVLQFSSPVRLACVKHAASVHPEPGSNSLIKFVRVQENPWLSLSSFYCLFESVLIKNSLEFSRLVVSLFSYQSTLWLFACLLSLATASLSYDLNPELSTPNLKIFFIPYFAWFSVFCLNSVKTKKRAYHLIRSSM